MKKKEVPQDKGPLEDFTREVVYAKNEDGKYEKALSKGWDVKKEALDNAWEKVHSKVAEAERLVRTGKKSPVYFFMEKNLMDIKVLCAYTGFNRFAVKRHMKPKVFAKLKKEKLQKYADTFDISVDELTGFGK